MKRALRGVNLGGWLIAERWMTPELFEGVRGEGEIELVRQLGNEEAVRRLIRHRDTFITEKDFAWIAKHGIEVVRLPVGYWLFIETDEYVEGEEYVRQAFSWAEKYGVKIILDLHGLPGSQNGKAHSGEVGKTGFYKCKNIRKTLGMVRHVATSYGHMHQLLAIEVINEPEWSLFGLKLWHYYRKALKIIIKNAHNGMKIVISDGYKPYRAVRLIKILGFRDRLILDIHLYQVFTKADRYKSSQDYKTTAFKYWRELIEHVSNQVPVMIGEWSAAVGTIPNNDGSFEGDYFRIQQQVFDETVWAHCYWSYKAPGRGAWDYIVTANRGDKRSFLN